MSYQCIRKIFANTTLRTLSKLKHWRQLSRLEHYRSLSRLEHCRIVVHCQNDSPLCLLWLDGHGMSTWEGQIYIFHLWFDFSALARWKVNKDNVRDTFISLPSPVSMGLMLQGRNAPRPTTVCTSVTFPPGKLKWDITKVTFIFYLYFFLSFQYVFTHISN